jgi:hypothetical protein
MSIDNKDALRLRQELAHQRRLVEDLREELEEKNNLYIKILAVSKTPYSWRLYGYF